MEVNKETLNYLAKLSRLYLEEGEKDQLVTDLNNILALVEQLKEVDTSGIEPLIFINEADNELREDIVVHSTTQAEALSNSPLIDENYFLVPKVIG